MRIVLIFVLLFFYISSGLSQVTISGSAVSYAGAELDFMTYTDPFTQSEIELGKCKVSANGDFSVVLPVNETTYIFSHLGIYKGFMLAEPGKTYSISFPDKKDKTSADKLNPFYEETEFQFIIKKSEADDINSLAQSFNNSYLPYYNKFARNLYLKNKKDLIDSAVLALKNLNPKVENPFYKSYVTYKIGYLKFMANQQKSKSISKEYFENRPVLYNNPAYLELFNQVFIKYFYFFSKTLSGKKIIADINNDKSLFKLNQTLLTDSVLKGDTLREFVILKNIHDEFYSNNFSRSGLLNLLDSLISLTKIEKHKNIAKYIRYEITKLMPGYPPPAFELYDINGRIVKLSDFLGTYVYLNFCVCSSYSCIKEFDLLNHLCEKYKNKLQVITISTDESLELMKDFVTKYKYNWLFLHYGNQPGILKEYDVRAYPTYFLIDNKGKLVFSPAASPSENFELFLFQVMKSRGDLNIEPAPQKDVFK